MAGGGLPDVFGALGSGLQNLAGGASGGGGGSSGGPIPDFSSPANAPNTSFTDPTVNAPAALTAGDPTGQGRQEPVQLPEGQTFTPPQPKDQTRLPGAGVNWTSPANLGATGGPPPAQQQQWPSDTSPLTPGVSPQTQTGLTQQAEIAAGYRPPEATDADLAQAAEEQARKQGAGGTDQGTIGASSINTDQQGGQQARQQNPLQTAGNMLKRVADRTPGPGATRGQSGGGGFNLIKAIGDLITQGPGAFAQDLQGLTNQVGSNYGPEQYGSQGGARGYGYGADQPPAQTAASGPPTQQPSAPQPPTTPQTPEAQAAAQDPAAAAQAKAAAVGTAPTQAPPPAQTPTVQQASLTTGQTGGGAATQPIAQNEIQASPYSRHGMPPMKPTQPHVDVSPLRSEIGNPRTVHQMAQMVSQEVSLKPGNTRAQIVQLETLRNRALYGIQGNGRYPDGSRAPTSLAQAGQTVHGGPYSRAGYSGYYPDYSRQRVSPQQMEKFKREVYDVVFPPDGSPGSNLSDVGYGPMTGNASNDPRMGERGMVAKHQYLRGTQGYSMRKAGGDDYFREHVRPGDGLGQPGGGATTAQAVTEPQRFTTSPYDKSFTDLYRTVGQLAPGGLPTQDWRRSSNVEQQDGAIPMDPSTSGSSPETRADWMAGNQSPQRATLMAAQLGSNDIDPLLNQLAQQWAQQTMAGPVPMPRPRPR